MKKNKPVLSIILPVLNSSRFLEACLKSIFSQSFREIEVIAIDDNSKDNSFEILSKFQKKEKRLKIYRNIKRYGTIITLNRCTRRIKGKFVTFMNPNDLITKNKIKKQVEFLTKNPKVVAVGTQCYYMDHDNKRCSKSTFDKDHYLITHKPLPTLSMEYETALINKELLPKDIFKFDKLHPFIFSEIFIKFAQFGDLANINEFLHFHRKDEVEPSKFDLEHLISFGKLIFKSAAVYDYRPTSIKNLFATLSLR